MADYIDREAAIATVMDWCPDDDGSVAKTGDMRDLLDEIESIPAADVPSALWTDDPISGTEFMTHNQGQSGFEIHFRTDDKAKYEAVQDECRRQIDHAKPAADVRPVARGQWKRVDPRSTVVTYRCSECNYYAHMNATNFCPHCGADMRGEETAIS